METITSVPGSLSLFSTLKTVLWQISHMFSPFIGSSSEDGNGDGDGGGDSSAAGGEDAGGGDGVCLQKFIFVQKSCGLIEDTSRKKSGA